MYWSIDKYTDAAKYWKSHFLGQTHWLISDWVMDITGDSIQNQVDISFNEEISKPLKWVLNCNGVISTSRSSQSCPNLFYMLNCNGVPSTKHIHWKWHQSKIKLFGVPEVYKKVMNIKFSMWMCKKTSFLWLIYA